MTKKSVYLDWLRDAYAMEMHAESLLKAFVMRLDELPLLKVRFTEYLEQSLQQQQQLKRVLKGYDHSWSALKEALGRLSALGLATTEMLREEQGRRLAISGYVFCRYKAATYTTLFVAAQQVHDTLGVEILQHIVQQETEMAEWLLQQLSHVAQAELVECRETGMPNLH